MSPKLGDFVKSRFYKKDSIESDLKQKNKLVIHSLDSPRSVSNFIFLTNELLKLNYKEIVLDFTNVAERQFPNACVPIASIIQLYQEQGVSFVFESAEKILSTMNFDSPLITKEEVINGTDTVLTRIWQFSTPSDAQKLVEILVIEISEQIICDPGVIRALDWCLYEVMDNVFQHSKQGKGYIMGQVHKETKKVAICICDVGIGILKSFVGSKYSPENDADAITLAIQEGVTRDGSIGQGNGLWGLHRIIQNNEGGRLTITSGKASLVFGEKELTKKSDHLPIIADGEHAMSIFDIQIDTNNPIDISLALKSNYSSNLTYEKLEDKNMDQYNIFIKDHSHGYSTRQSAEKLRNLIINLIHDNPQCVSIDFDQVHLISSSFADELLGKLLVEFGFYKFNKIFRLKNVSQENENIIHTVISQRLKTELDG